MCWYILIICIIVSVCLTYLSSSSSVDMLHCSSVPAYLLITLQRLESALSSLFSPFRTYAIASLETVSLPVSGYVTVSYAGNNQCCRFIYRSGHPENQLFLLSKTYIYSIKVSTKNWFNFEKTSPVSIGTILKRKGASEITIILHRFILTNVNMQTWYQWLGHPFVFWDGKMPSCIR